MTRKEWAEIKAAAELLGLGEDATLAEIKKAYRRQSKKHHPDVRRSLKQEDESIQMHELTESYKKLLQYCTEYRFSFVPGENEQFDGEDWWFERFGQDHLWGKGSVPKDDTEE
jgi:DnaJ-class molecular chaperone